MKSLICLLLLAAVSVSGCGKKSQPPPMKFEGVAVAAVASGAKTKSGKPVDVYEVTVKNDSALFLLVGGGKLESSEHFLKLNGNEFLVEFSMMKNTVLVVDMALPAPLLLEGATAADAKPKCSAGKVIDLPIDELLATPRPGMPTR